MITVKLFGLLRLNSGIKELRLEAKDVKQLREALVRQTDRITMKELSGCIILVNGRRANGRSRLKDGDEVILLTPIAGG